MANQRAFLAEDGKMTVFEKLPEKGFERLLILSDPQDKLAEKSKKSKKTAVILTQNVNGFADAQWICDEMRAGGHNKTLITCVPKLNLKDCISIHDLTLGTALGGARYYPYTDEAQMIRDVLSLSPTMTDKASMSNLNLGGGKSNIWGDPQKDKNDDLLERFGEEIDFLEGEYTSAEDSGINRKDISVIRRKTKYVVGLPETYLEVRNGVLCRGSGDPGRITAKALIYCMKAALSFKNKGNLRGKTVTVWGLGSVGLELARFLYEEGANLVICDNDENKIRRFFGWAAIVDPDEVCKVECDILAPCITLGGILNEEIIAKLNCAIIIGSTNNMLASPNCATLLRKRGILYGPDFVVNAGGLMNVYEELQPGGYNEANVLKRIAETIPLNLFKIFRRSEKLNLSTHEVAKIMAQERIKLKKDKISILADLFRTTNKEIKDMLEGEESELDKYMSMLFQPNYDF